MPYDGFVSYSHAADGKLAPAVQRGLQRLAKPWYRRRSLHVFRDSTSLSANPGLWSSITEALDDSEFFVLLASPEAASSEWVNREVQWWCDHKDVGKILPVLTEGEWVWDDAAGGFDLAASTAVPAALVGAFAEEPRHLDMCWARSEVDLDLRNSRFRDQIAQLAAPMHHVPKDELVGEDVLVHRRARRLAVGAAIALAVLTLFSLGAAAQALRNADEAEQNLAQARQAQAEADANAEEASRNAAEAEANAAEASRNADEADANAAEADANAEEASRNAAEAEANADEASRNAAEADRQRGSAEASAAEADRQRQAAEASAAEAARQRDTAQLSAEEARRQEQLAAQEAARAAAEEAMAQQAQAEAEAAAAALADANQELADTVDQLDTANRDLGAANEGLAASNAELTSTNLAVEALRAADGQLDLALLLAVESARTAAGERTARAGAGDGAVGDAAARNALRSVLLEADRGVVGLRAVPPVGEPIDDSIDLRGCCTSPHEATPPGSSMHRSRLIAFDASGSRVAAAPTTAGVHVWDLGAPTAPPLLLPAPDLETAFFDAVTVAEMGFVGDGGVLAVRSWAGATDGQSVALHDTASGQVLFEVRARQARYVVSPDGATVAVQTVEGGCDPADFFCDPATAPPPTPTVTLLDGATGAVRGSWTALLGSVLGGDAYRADGGQLLMFDLADAAMTLRDTSTPAVSVSLYVPAPGAFAGPVFADGGTRVVAPTAADELTAFDPATGQTLGTIPWTSAVAALASADDGSLVAVLGRGGTVGALEARSLAPLGASTAVDGCATRVRVSPEGRWIIADRAIPSVSCGEVVDYVPTPSQVGRSPVRRSGRHIAFGPPSPFGPDDGVEVDAMVDDDVIWHHDLTVASLEFGRRLATDAGVVVGADGRVVTTSSRGVELYSTGLFDPSVRLGASVGVDALVTGPDGLVAGFSAAGPLVLWDLDELDLGDDLDPGPSAPPGCEPEWSHALDPGGRYVAHLQGTTDVVVSCLGPPELLLFDRDTGTTRSVDVGQTSPVAVQWSEDGGMVQTIDSFAEVTTLYDPATGARLGEVPGRVVASDVTGSRLVGSLATGELEVRPTASPTDVVATIDGGALQGSDSPGCGAFTSSPSFALSPGGSLLAGTDGTEVLVWDVRTGEEVQRLSLSSCPQATGLEVSDDGARLAVFAARSGEVTAWDTGSWQRVAAVVLDDPLVRDATGEGGAPLEYSPDGELLLAGGVLLEARTLRPLGGALVGEPPGGSGSLDVAYAPGDLELLLLDEGTGRLTGFALDVPTLSAAACERAGRNLTSLERLRFSLTDPRTCPQWPAQP